jgi:hypothetical protein
MRIATEEKRAEHVLKQAKAIPASHIVTTCTKQGIMMLHLLNILNRTEVRRERTTVGKEMVSVLL